MSQAEIATPPMAGTSDLGIDLDPLTEVVAGREVAKPTMGAFEHVILSVLSLELGIYAKEHNLGRVIPEGLFRLQPSEKRLRRPDVAFVSRERWGIGRKVTSANGINVVPDLTVEVVSPTDLAVEVLEKVREYLDSGVIQVWLIYPGAREVHVYEGARSCRIVRSDDSIDGGSLLAGFKLALTELFRDGEPGDLSGGIGVDPE